MLRDLDFNEEFAVPDFVTNGRGNVGVILHFIGMEKLIKCYFCLCIFESVRYKFGPKNNIEPLPWVFGQLEFCWRVASLYSEGRGCLFFFQEKKREKKNLRILLNTEKLSVDEFQVSRILCGKN